MKRTYVDYSAQAYDEKDFFDELDGLSISKITNQKGFRIITR